LSSDSGAEFLRACGAGKRQQQRYTHEAGVRPGFHHQRPPKRITNFQT
jgi:hypothetical protein